MNSGQRTAVSLLVSVVLFTGFIFTVYSTVFNKIETKFYEPERINLEKTQLKESAEFCNSYIQNLLEKTQEYAAKDAVLSYLTQTPTESEVTERVKLSGELFVALPALDGFRFLDKNARNLHYSSYASDIVKQQGTTKVYRNYSDIEKIAGECEFSLVSINEDSPYKLSFNKAKNQINISVPVFDKYKLFRGNFVFYFKTLELERELVKNGYISVGEAISLFISEDSMSAGVVAGLPNIGKELFVEPVLASWQDKSEGPVQILSQNKDSENYSEKWVVLSDFSSSFLTFSEVYTVDYFILPDAVRILILVCVFVTLFLIIFLLFSFKIDDMVIIRSRIRKIQFAFVTEYLENKDSVDWNQLSRQIEGRREDLFRDVKKSLGRKGRKHEKQVDALLNKSWDEILSAIGTRTSYENQISQNSASNAELKRMLEEVLSNSELKVKAVPSPRTEKPVPLTELVEELSDAEEVESLEDAESVEELSDAEEIEALEDVEAVEELSDAEEVEALEDAEAVEELSDVEEIEVLEDVEEAEELSDAEEIEALEDVEAVEELSDAEEVESLEDAEPVEELSDVEEVESLEDAEAVEELSDAEEVESLEDVEAVEELSDAEEVESLEDAEAVEEISDAEDFDTIETTEKVSLAKQQKVRLEKIEEVEKEIESEIQENDLLVNEKISLAKDIPVQKKEEPVELLEDEEESLVLNNESDIEEILDTDEEIQNEETTEDFVEEILDVEEEIQNIEPVEDSVEEILDIETEAVEKSSEVEELLSDETELVEELDAEESEPVEETELVEELETEELDLQGFETEEVVLENIDTEDERDLFFKEENVIFVSPSEDSFATVENVFGEELRFGESYTDVLARNNAGEIEMPVSFSLTDPEFGDDEELIPFENEINTFTMAGFGANNNNVTELEVEENSEDAIVEREGVYSISQFLETSSVDLDKNFKKLVDSVLR